MPAMQRLVATILREDLTIERYAFELIEKWLFLYTTYPSIFSLALVHCKNDPRYGYANEAHTQTDFIYLVSIIGLKNESIFWDIFVDNYIFGSWNSERGGWSDLPLFPHDVSGWSELVYMCVLRITTERLHLYIYIYIKKSCSWEELFLSLFLFWNIFWDIIFLGLWIEAVLNLHHKRHL